jgi:hypothetical protein
MDVLEADGIGVISESAEEYMAAFAAQPHAISSYNQSVGGDVQYEYEPVAMPPDHLYSIDASRAQAASAVLPFARRGGSRRTRTSRSQLVSFHTAGRQREQQLIVPTPGELALATTGRARIALDIWYQRLNELNQYRLENGDCNVPQKYEENPKLGIVRTLLSTSLSSHVANQF